MSFINSILTPLSDGCPHPLSQLAARLEPSESIESVIPWLQDNGYPIEVIGEQLRWIAATPLLSVARVRAGLNADTTSLLRDIEVHDERESTNLCLLQRVTSTGATIVLAEQQTAGRGRRGKTWHSPPCSNLYLSMDWVFASAPDQLTGLSLGVGIKLVEALAPLLQQPLGLKWPNDLYIDGRKLAGILIESTFDSSGNTRVIIGIGLNVTMQGEQLIDQPWTSVARHVDDPGALDRNVLAGRIINRLLPFLADYPDQGAQYIQQHWRDHDVTWHQPVEVRLGDATLTGTGFGIDEQFRFLMQQNNGNKQAFASADISLRLR